MTDLVALVSKNLREIRKQLAGTQERFAEMCGTSQAQISRLENGRGWSTLDGVAAMLKQAGGDPMDLINQDGTVADADEAEIRRLLPLMDQGTKSIILAILRREAERQGLQDPPGQSGGAAS